MKTIIRISCITAVLFGSLPGLWTPVAKAAVSNCAEDALQASGAVYRICMPGGTWNGDLVVYAHGFVAFNEPIAIPEDQLSLPEGPTIPELVNGLSFAFATTSYGVNGLAVRQGLADLLDLVEIFRESHGEPGRVYLIGPSEGGLITALALEKHPDVFDGGLSACGPVGDFPSQINYWGDVRVLFDYYFPGLLPGSITHVPQEVMDNWESLYESLIAAELRNHPFKRAQFMNVANIAQHLSDPEQNVQAVLDVLWYTVFATNDGIEKLGGQPYDNRLRIYRGSTNDQLLNITVPRYSADASAVDEMQSHYQTHGNLQAPIVMLHTIDPVIPFWHEPVYRFEVRAMQNQALHLSIPVLGRYGHCNFTVSQLLVGFVLLLHRVTGQVIPDAEQVLTSAEQRQEYLDLLKEELWRESVNATLYLPMLQADAP